MHASYQIIIQVLQLAYTTQACISNLKNLCNASKLLLSKNVDLSFFFNVAPSLSMPMSNLYFFVSISPKAFISYLSPLYNLNLKAFISLYNLSPLSSIFIKGVLLIDAKVCIWGRWLRLEFCIFDGHHLIVGMTPLVDTTCNLYHLYLV